MLLRINTDIYSFREVVQKQIQFNETFINPCHYWTKWAKFQSFKLLFYGATLLSRRAEQFFFLALGFRSIKGLSL